MSDAKTRIALSEARALAAEVYELLRPYTERLEIAGSIRRERETIGDLELLAVPAFGERTVDLFGGTEPVNLLREEVDRLLGEGMFDLRLSKAGQAAFGERYARLLYRGFALDLFSCLKPAEFGVLFVIRTGSADFSHRLVTPVEQGGWMPRGMVCKDGALWRISGAHWLKLSTPDEREVFDAIGRPWIEPRDREVQAPARRTWMGMVCDR